MLLQLSQVAPQHVIQVRPEVSFTLLNDLIKFLLLGDDGVNGLGLRVAEFYQALLNRLLFLKLAILALQVIQGAPHIGRLLGLVLTVRRNLRLGAQVLAQHLIGLSKRQVALQGLGFYVGEGLPRLDDEPDGGGQDGKP